MRPSRVVLFHQELSRTKKTCPIMICLLLHLHRVFQSADYMSSHSKHYCLVTMWRCVLRWNRLKPNCYHQCLVLLQAHQWHQALQCHVFRLSGSFVHLVACQACKPHRDFAAIAGLTWQRQILKAIKHECPLLLMLLYSQDIRRAKPPQCLQRQWVDRQAKVRLHLLHSVLTL